MPAVGVYPILDRTISIAAMFDCAMSTAQMIKGNEVCRLAVYDHALEKELEDNRALMRQLRKALDQEELTFNLQPLYNIRSGKIVGLEARARWQHPERGLILPGDFIPMLEEQGFVTTVDRYIWEKTCSAMSQWIKSGLKPVPVSVNVSLVDLRTLDLPEELMTIAGKHQVPPELIRVEIGENAFIEDGQWTAEVVQKLRRYGFLVFLDHCGSNYSLFELVPDIKVNALKIDTRWLEGDPSRMKYGTQTLETVVDIANLMDVKLIAEGVETPQQAQFLSEIGCVYAQGYFYCEAKPHNEMERILAEPDNIDENGIEARTPEQLPVDESYSRNAISERMLNNILDRIGISGYNESLMKMKEENRKAAADILSEMVPCGMIGGYCEPDFPLYFANEEMVRLLGYSSYQELTKCIDGKVIHMIYEEDREAVVRDLGDKYYKGMEYITKYRTVRKDGSMFWTLDKGRVVEAEDGRLAIVSVCIDISEGMAVQEELKQINKRLEEVGRQDKKILENIMEKSTYSLKANLTKDRLILDKGSRKWLKDNGYEKSTSFSMVIEKAVKNAILPDYKEKMGQFLNRENLLRNYEEGIQSQVCEYRRIYDGNTCWMQGIYHLMHLDDTEDVFIYLYTVNIDEQKSREMELTQRAEFDQLTGLYNRQTAIPRIKDYLMCNEDKQAAIIMFDLDNFKNINDCKGHVYGDEVLSSLAYGLKNYFRRDDILCRIGGDEFLALCKGISEESLQIKLSEILQNLVHVYQFNGRTYRCSISAGYVMTPEYGKNFQELYKKADAALFAAKRAGRKRYRGFKK